MPPQPLTARLAALILETMPYAYCYACLANKLTVTEKDVREAAQFLLVQPGGFQTALRVCYICDRTDRLLIRAMARSEGESASAS